MIVLREIKECEKRDVDEFLNKNNILDNDFEKNDLVYMMLEEGLLVGTCKVTIEKDYGILKYVCISNERRGSNLGEALLRATFFKLYAYEIKKIYFLKENNYLLKKDFEKINRNQINRSNFILKCNLDALFSKKCCGVGKSDL